MSNHTFFYVKKMEELKELRTRDELADYIGVPRSKLTYILYVKKTENLYTSFDIPKKNGGVRHIHAPRKELKQIQKNLAEVLYRYEKELANVYGTNLNISHAFERKKSIITNAKIHRNKRFVINIDLENFFDSFHFGRVRGYFMKNKNYQFSKEIATIIAQITCYEGKLPQGAPSSPVITNMICNIFDMRLLRLAKKYKIDYTRYADDLSFSTNDKKFLNLEQQFFDELHCEVKRAGFSINEKKTRVQYRDSHQEVTGIVVNKKLNVDREYCKATRAMAHQLYKTGEYTIDGDEKGTMAQLEGRFSFINQLDKYNNNNEEGPHQFEYLNGREKTYSQFLFYKYFFANEKPIFITEGKTDVIYLKAALKNMWKDYPDFITKKDNGQFEYKIAFLKRSKRIEYFLNIKLDGADTLNNIMEFYRDGGNPKYPNYMKQFRKLSGQNPYNLVMLLFDNEITDGNSPVAKFSRKWMKNEQKENLKKCNWTYLQDNVFISTTPLIDEEDKTDIEMLFDQMVQSVEIEGRTLDKTGTKDKTKYFNKDIFSRYIMKHYEEINFDNFRSIFNNMREAMVLYQKVKQLNA